jgi:hypothetical protein
MHYKVSKQNIFRFYHLEQSGIIAFFSHSFFEPQRHKGHRGAQRV